MKTIKLSALKQDKKNARKHTARNIGMIEQSLREVGAARSGVIDETQTILAGNGTYEALAAAGIEKVKIVEANGNEWVVVQRKGLTAEQKRKLAIADNRAGELASWDAAALQEQGVALEEFFTDRELDGLYREKAEEEKPEVEFTAEFNERQDYILLRFENVLDWQAATQVFDLKPVAIGSSIDKRVERWGRVIDGAAVLKRLQDADSYSVLRTRGKSGGDHGRAKRGGRRGAGGAGG